MVQVVQIREKTYFYGKLVHKQGKKTHNDDKSLHHRGQYIHSIHFKSNNNKQHINDKVKTWIYYILNLFCFDFNTFMNMLHPAITFCLCLVHAECFVTGEAYELGVTSLLVISIADPAATPLCCIQDSHEVLHSVFIYVTGRSMWVTTDWRHMCDPIHCHGIYRQLGCFDDGR